MAAQFAPIDRRRAKPVEQPRCRNCGDRRIYHRRGLGGSKGYPWHEEPIPCSARHKEGLIWVYCGCSDYQPDEWTAA